LQDKQSDPARSKYRIHPQAVARAVSDLAARDAVFVIDTGLNTLWPGNWIRQSGEQRIIGSFNNGRRQESVPRAPSDLVEWRRWFIDADGRSLDRGSGENPDQDRGIQQWFARLRRIGDEDRRAARYLHQSGKPRGLRHARRASHGSQSEYAARLKSELECMDGFISVERFQSLTEPDKLLSRSFWRDEEAVASWRSRAGHHTAQSAGRQAIFRDYRLRVAAVIRDYGMSERREQAPADSRAVYDISV
jgi:heme-degrading monooxygenase HmoA